MNTAISPAPKSAETPKAPTTSATSATSATTAASAATAPTSAATTDSGKSQPKTCLADRFDKSLDNLSKAGDAGGLTGILLGFLAIGAYTDSKENCTKQ